MKRTFAHIVSPVKVGPSSDLHIAQPVTFESMRVARDLAAASSTSVELCAVNFPEDDEIVPPFFRRGEHLKRSVLDVATFSIPRKLPLIKDILDSIVVKSEADYIIYSNVDIGLLPHFYSSVASIIDEGHDAFMITRRTLSKQYTEVSQLWRMYADIGDRHSGNDCFIFRRAAYADYYFGDACIGARVFAKVLGLNLILHAKSFRHFKDLHLTFHIGNTRAWRDNKYIDYERHNRAIAREILFRHRDKLPQLGDNALVARWLPKIAPELRTQLSR